LFGEDEVDRGTSALTDHFWTIIGIPWKWSCIVEFGSVISCGLRIFFEVDGGRMIIEEDHNIWID